MGGGGRCTSRTGERWIGGEATTEQEKLTRSCALPRRSFAGERMLVRLFVVVRRAIRFVGRWLLVAAGWDQGTENKSSLSA